MPFDGSAWDETSPTNAYLANEIDDIMRDMKIAVRSRMAHEHNWSASQTATGSDGGHRYITLTTQTSTPSLVYGTSTQAAVIFADTANSVLVSDKTGVVYTIVKSAVGLVLANGTGTTYGIPYVKSGGGIAVIGPADSGYQLISTGASAAPVWSAISGTPEILNYGTSASSSSAVAHSALKICYGTVSVGQNANVSVTNLPFTGANTFAVTIGPAEGTPSTSLNVVTQVKQDSGSQFTIYNKDGDSGTLTVNWIAIGY